MDTSPSPIDFTDLRAAAEKDSWPEHLAKITDWPLLLLEQEAELMNLAYDRKNWRMLERMLGCGVGCDCIEALLDRCGDVNNPRAWPEFAEKLFLTQLPYCRKDICLSAQHLSQLLRLFLYMHRSTFQRFWDYIPYCIDMLFCEAGPENASQFIEVLVRTYHFVMAIQTIRPDKLTRKWQIIYKVLEHFPPLRGHFLDYLHQPGKTSSEARALIYNAVQHEDLVGLNILRQLQSIMPVARSFIDEQLEKLSTSSAAFGAHIF